MADEGLIENSVLRGRDGYLFLAGGSHKVFEIVTGATEIPPDALQVFSANLRGRMAWAATRGVPYAHVIMPDKQSVIPGHWPMARPPLQMGAAFVEHCAEQSGALIYPAAALSAQWQRTVPRTDTHFHDYGSILVTAALAQRFSGQDEAVLRDRLLGSITTSAKQEAGDLGAKLNPPALEFAEPAGLAMPGPFFSNLIAGGNNGLIDLRFNPQAPYQKRVALFGDSFGRQIARFLQYWFTEVYYFRTGQFHDEIADLCQPDILITENVERYLDNPSPDENRPHFLLYPFMQEKAYTLSGGFAEALSAVLSYPRPPYLNFIAGLAPARPGVRQFDGLRLTDTPAEHGLLGVLEAPLAVPQPAPAMVADLSGRGLNLKLGDQQQIHGSYLVHRADVLLFGSNHLVDGAGAWSCEARAFKGQFLDMLKWPFYEAIYPGPKPVVDALLLRTGGLSELQVERIETPVFLATPLEPDNWGRWLVTVVPKAAQYLRHGAGRKFFCRMHLPWQRAFLNTLGLTDAMILPHDPGRTYMCRDVMTVEYSEANMTISPDERAIFFATVARLRRRGASPAKLFISRLSRSQKAPNYRVLQNEAELAAVLADQGFVAVEPETLPFEEQISLFAGASQVVGLGGAAIYNAVFCAPGTDFITIESSDSFINPHSQLLSSLGLRYGIIFGRQTRMIPRRCIKDGASMPRTPPRRWLLSCGSRKQAPANLAEYLSPA